MKKWKKRRVVAVLLTLLVLLQFPADFGSVAHAAQKNEIRGTISVASNISQPQKRRRCAASHRRRCSSTCMGLTRNILVLR